MAAVALVEACFAASAFFISLRAKRLRYASLLPEATRQGFFSVAGFVFGVSAVTRAGGVACGAGVGVSSGIVSSGCVAIMYIFLFLKFTRFLLDSCQFSPSFLPGSFKIPASLANFIKALEWIAFAVSPWVCGRVQSYQDWLLRLTSKLDVFCCDESDIGQRQPAPAPQSKAPSKGG